MGIDYGLGKTNVDTETGIRYGVIDQNELLQAWYDESEAKYGPPTCPDCGNELKMVDDIDRADIEPEYHDDFDNTLGDYWCETCNVGVFDDEIWDGAEPLCHYIDKDGMQAHCGESGNIFVTKSPYYTWCDYCSPCAPGAGCLMSSCAMEDSKNNPEDWETTNDCKAYCFGHDWFEGDKAPYKVYDVETDEEVKS